jgi:hypothetical protein
MAHQWHVAQSWWVAGCNRNRDRSVASTSHLSEKVLILHASFNSICADKQVPRTPDALGQLGQNGAECAPLTDVQISRISPSIFYRLYETFLLLGSSLQEATS